MGSCRSILALISLSFIVSSGERPLPEDEEDREDQTEAFIMYRVYLLLIGGFAPFLIYSVISLIRAVIRKNEKSRKCQGTGGKVDAGPTRDSAPPDTVVSIPPESESPQTGPELSTIKPKGNKRVDNCSTRGMTDADGTPWDAIVPISSSSSSSDSSEVEAESSSEDDPHKVCEICGRPGASTYEYTEYTIYWD